mgnify:CR=1 FL=1
MDFDKKEFYGIVAKAKKQMQITIDQDCNVADTKPDDPDQRNRKDTGNGNDG